jgi:hypothetical protein
MGIIKTWLVVNVWTQHSLLVEAVGPRDAVFSIAGWQRTEARAGWLYAGDWKVRTSEVRAPEVVAGSKVVVG